MNKSAQTPKQMSEKNFFKKENYISSKNAAGRADCSWDKLGKKLPTKRFLDQTSKKCGRLQKISNMFFHPKTSTDLDCGFRKSGENFR